MDTVQKADSARKTEPSLPFMLDVYRSAQLRFLAAQPLHDPDLLGRYASLLMENLPPMAVVLCLLDKKYTLIETHVLASGPLAEPENYVLLIVPLYKKANAAYGAVLLAPRAGEYGYTGEDERLASKITLYCQRQKIRLLECVTAWSGGYVPIYRHVRFSFR